MKPFDSKDAWLILGIFVIAALWLLAPQSASATAVVSGFNSTGFGPNDDGSFPCTGSGGGIPSGCTPTAVTLPFTPHFFGTTSSQIFINNNGNLTFGSPLGTFTPFGLTSHLGEPIIAPFFADVDTRAGNTVTFGTGTFDGHTTFGVNWPGVGYFSEHTNLLNNFQTLLVDRSDTGAGNFDIVYNYNQIRWETGDASGGVGGFGGTSAHVGFSDGSGNPGTFFELAGSGVHGGFLDSNPTTGLINHDLNSSVLGRYIFDVRGGTPIVSAPEPSTAALFGLGLAGLGNLSWRRRRRAARIAP